MASQATTTTTTPAGNNKHQQHQDYADGAQQQQQQHQQHQQQQQQQQQPRQATTGGNQRTALAPIRQPSIPMANALLSTINAARQRQPMCAECERSLPNQIVFDKIESIIRLMQDEQNGLPVKTAKSFMSKIPSVFTGTDLIQWMMRNLKLEDQQEAIHLANLIASHGYIFPIEDHTLSIKNDCTFYRFQTPCLWPSNNSDPENTDYAVYLCKRTMQGKTRLELADYEAENLARLQKMFSRKWEFIFMQAESQAKVDKKRDKLERKVLDSQERAFWDVYRPVPGCVNTTELDIKKACRLSKSAKRCSECQKVAAATLGQTATTSGSVSLLTAPSPEVSFAPDTKSGESQLVVRTNSSPTGKTFQQSALTESGSSRKNDDQQQVKATTPVMMTTTTTTTSTTTTTTKDTAQQSEKNNNRTSASQQENKTIEHVVISPVIALATSSDSGKVSKNSNEKQNTIDCVQLLKEEEKFPVNVIKSNKKEIQISSEQPPQKLPTSSKPPGEDSSSSSHKELSESKQASTSSSVATSSAQKAIAAHQHHHQHPHQHPHDHHHHHHHHHHHPHTHQHGHHHHHHHQCAHHKHHTQAAAQQHQRNQSQQQQQQQQQQRLQQQGATREQQLSMPTESILTTTVAATAGWATHLESVSAKKSSGQKEEKGEEEKEKEEATNIILDTRTEEDIEGVSQAPADITDDQVMADGTKDTICSNKGQQSWSKKRSMGSMDRAHHSNQLMRATSTNSATNRRKSDCNRLPSMIENTTKTIQDSQEILDDSQIDTPPKTNIIDHHHHQQQQQQQQQQHQVVASNSNFINRPASAIGAFNSNSSSSEEQKNNNNNRQSSASCSNEQQAMGQNQRSQGSNQSKQQQVMLRKSSLNIMHPMSVVSGSTSGGFGEMVSSGSGAVGEGLESASISGEGGNSLIQSRKNSSRISHHSPLKGAKSVACGQSSYDFGLSASGGGDRQHIGDLKRELEKLRLARRIGGVKMSKVTQSYLSYFKQWAEYDPYIAQPIPSNPWISDSTELWDSERQTKDVHCRRVRRWAFSLKELLNDPAGREQFHRFLEKEFSAENLKFWDAVQDLKRVHSRDVARRVEIIWTEYLAQDANCPINIDSKSYETSKQNMAKNRNNRCIFDEAAGHVYQLMKNDSYPRYLRSEMYKDYKEASEKKRNQAFDVFKPQITTLKHKFNF